MMYETTTQPPQAGSWHYLLFVVLYNMREDRAYRAQMLQSTAVLAASSEDKGAGKVFQQQLEQFIEASYPYSKSQKEEKERKTKEVLDRMSGQAFKINELKKGRRRY